MKDKKGFTLVELLAIIVVLVIIALVLVPVVNNIVYRSKKKAFEDSVLVTGKNVDEYLLKYDFL